MYRYFMDYDLTQYQQLENKLNELSQKGLHPVHLGRISSFKEKDTHYYYHVDILTKKPSVPQKKAIRDMISDYEIPEKLDNQMKSKLQRSLTAYGIASEIGMSSFAMVPEVVINDEHTTTTVPVYCNIDFDLVVINLLN